MVIFLYKICKILSKFSQNQSKFKFLKDKTKNNFRIRKRNAKKLRIWRIQNEPVRFHYFLLNSDIRIKSYILLKKSVTHFARSPYAFEHILANLILVERYIYIYISFPANDIYIYISFTFCVRIFLRWILAHSLSKSYRWGKWCPWKVWYMSAFTHETIREILKQFWGGSKNQRFVTPYTGFGWNCVTIRSIIQMIYIYIICAWRG